MNRRGFQKIFLMASITPQIRKKNEHRKNGTLIPQNYLEKELS